jgi:hypothetical protein
VFLTEGAVKAVIPDDRTSTADTEWAMDPCVVEPLDISEFRGDEWLPVCEKDAFGLLIREAVLKIVVAFDDTGF